MRPTAATKVSTEMKSKPSTPSFTNSCFLMFVYCRAMQRDAVSPCTTWCAGRVKQLSAAREIRLE
jgi:hypothetical protein